jgi:hypothetical protein
MVRAGYFLKDTQIAPAGSNKRMNGKKVIHPAAKNNIPTIYSSVFTGRLLVRTRPSA